MLFVYIMFLLLNKEKLTSYSSLGQNLKETELFCIFNISVPLKSGRININQIVPERGDLIVL
jgi:hypothetical protein